MRKTSDQAISRLWRPSGPDGDSSDSKDTKMPQVNRSQLIFMLIFLTLILPGPHDRSDGLASPVNKRRLKLFKEEITTSVKEVETASWASGYGNLTGFKLSYADSVEHRNATDWPLHKFGPGHPWVEDEKYSLLPNAVSARAKEIWRSQEAATYDMGLNFFQNVTGSLRGSFETLNQTYEPVPMSLPSYLTAIPKRPEDDLVQKGLSESSNNFDDVPTSPPLDGSGDRHRVGNITNVPHGKVKFDITANEKPAELGDRDAVGISLKLDLNDFDELNDNALSLSGVYFQETGNLVATTRTGKFAGLYGLPHLVLFESYFNKTRDLVAHQVKKIQVENIDLTKLDNLMDDADANCEYIVYAQFKPTSLSKKQLQEIEDEFANPLGRPIAQVPPVEVEAGLIYSPDCGVVVELGEMTGTRREIQLSEIRKFILFGIFILFSQIFLSIDQMNATNTPSTTSRISFWSIALMNLVDGSLSMLYLLCSAVIDELYLPLAVSSLLAFTLASVFEMRYMILIYSSQINERNINARVALQGTPLDDRVDTDNGTILPTTQRPANPPPEQQQQQQQPQFADDEQTISGQIYTRFFFVLVTFTFIILNSIMWPRKPRLVFEYICFIGLSSYWLPQIYRNVIRGSRKSFKWKFIVGTTVLRVLPITYVCLAKSNPFHHHYDPTLFLTVITWLGLQILFLALQEFFGPRFLLPDRYLPKSYDYHPVLTELDLENGFGIEHDELQPLVNHHEDGKCKVDCAICMAEVELPIQNGNSSVNPANILARRGYMVTPCRHIFHTACLEGWMKYKLQCPTCRNPLPPL